MTNARPPARLHVLMASEVPVAVVLRRGPAKQVACLRWDLRSNSIELGQWIKARIYERRSDISPCGRYTIYFALDGKWNREGRGAYTVLSKVPYFTALRLFPHGTTYGGGGLWSTKCYEAIGVKRRVKATEATRDVGKYGLADARVYFPRLIRDGSWMRILTG